MSTPVTPPSNAFTPAQLGRISQAVARALRSVEGDVIGRLTGVTRITFSPAELAAISAALTPVNPALANKVLLALRDDRTTVPVAGGDGGQEDGGGQ